MGGGPRPRPALHAPRPGGCPRRQGAAGLVIRRPLDRATRAESREFVRQGQLDDASIPDPDEETFEALHRYRIHRGNTPCRTVARSGTATGCRSTGWCPWPWTADRPPTTPSPTRGSTRPVRPTRSRTRPETTANGAEAVCGDRLGAASGSWQLRLQSSVRRGWREIGPVSPNADEWLLRSTYEGWMRSARAAGPHRRLRGCARGSQQGLRGGPPQGPLQDPIARHPHHPWHEGGRGRSQSGRRLVCQAGLLLVVIHQQAHEHIGVETDHPGPGVQVQRGPEPPWARSPAP